MSFKIFSELIKTPKILVKKDPNFENIVEVEWEKPSDEEILGFNIYGSYSLVYKEKLNTELIPQEINKLKIRVPLLTNGLDPYFFVSRVLYNNQEIFLEEEGISIDYKNLFKELLLPELVKDIYILDDEEIQYYFEEIRRRSFSIISVLGETFNFYSRMYKGIPCVCTKTKGTFEGIPEEYTGKTRCEKCFGTGIYGGYYPSFPIISIFVSERERIYLEKIGLKVEMRASLVTLWAPLIKQGDILERVKTGEKFIINEVNPRQIWKGFTDVQLATYHLIEPTNILNKITNEKILQNFEEGKLFNPKFKFFEII